ncbi:MAG: LuxR C-terminal-related transcriptional regulator [Acidimicrobiales bacterium]
MTALARAFEALVRTGGAVVVEDAQWLDDSTAGLLAEVALAGATPFTFCLRDGRSPAPLRALLASESCVTIRLGPLDREAVDGMVDSVTGLMDVGSQRRLYEATEGLPLLVRVLVESAVESGDLVRSDLGSSWNGRLTLDEPSASDILGRILPDLPADHRALLDLLAIAGPLPVSVARTLATDDQITGLEAARVVTERHGLLLIRRPIVGEIVAAAIGTFERHRISAKLVAATGADDSDDLAVRRIEWTLHAMTGGLIDRDPAVLLHGAELALDHGDADLASRLSEAAWTFDPTVESSLLVGLSAAVLGDRPKALSALEPIIVDPTMTLAVRHQALRSALRIADQPFVDRNETIVADILEQSSADEQHGDLVAAWSAAQAFVGRWHAARSTATPLADHPDISVRLRAAGPLTSGLLAEGRCQDAVTNAYEWLSDALSAGDGHGDAYRWAAVTLFSALLAAGRTTELEGLLVAASPDEGFWTCAMRGRVHLARGHGRSACTEFAAALREPHHQLWRGWVTALNLEALALTGGDATHLDESLTAAEPPPGVARNDFERSLAWAAVARGDLLGARSKLAALASRAAEDDHITFEAINRYELLRLGAIGRNADRLISLCSSWESMLAPPIADHAAGRKARDARRLEQAALTFAELGMDLNAAEAWVDAATQYRHDGFVDSTRRCSAAAASARERCGNPATPILSGLGPTVVLTARERDVASRAAAGDSSRQIAEALGVSVRTVDNLLGRVYTKLGVAGRGGLGAVMGTDRSGS